MAEVQEYEFGGRKFRPISQRTIECDFLAMAQVRASRIDSIQIEEGEDPGEYARRVMERAESAPEVFDLLGCVLIPSEVPDLDWSRATMRKTAEHLRRVVATEEKALLRRCLIEMVIGFFQSGIVSARTSRNSSSSAGSEALPGSGSAASATSATGI